MNTLTTCVHYILPVWFGPSHRVGFPRTNSFFILVRFSILWSISVISLLHLFCFHCLYWPSAKFGHVRPASRAVRILFVLTITLFSVFFLSNDCYIFWLALELLRTMKQILYDFIPPERYHLFITFSNS